MRRYCLGLDLKDGPVVAAEYKRYHEAVWPEILQSIRDAGIEQMEIYLLGNRLFMIMEVNDTFDFGRKDQMDKANPRVQEWETLMSKYQQRLPFASGDEKWVLMENVFDMRSQMAALTA